ncbi:MAG TPA: hypothetical protein VHU24_03245 [Solirubrobacterales bacterium]|nr:hypothetical protein [Solirubrobacterales bacterium]
MAVRRSKPLKGYKRLKGSAHHYETPRGKVITEYEYRSRKARRAGFRNYTQQRRVRERPAFMKIRFDALRHNPDADVGAGGELERVIVEFLSHRESSGASQEGPVPGFMAFPGSDGWPAAPGTGGMIGAPGERFAQLLEELGLPDWWKFRYWYSEVAIG